MGPHSHLQFLREPEGGTSSAQAQRQLRGYQEPRETQLVVQFGAGTLPQVRTLTTSTRVTVIVSKLLTNVERTLKVDIKQRIVSKIDTVS